MRPAHNVFPLHPRAGAAKSVLRSNPQGEIRLVVAQREGRTRIKHLYQAQPLRVLFPLAAPGDVFQAAIALVSGGLVGGDHLRVGIEAERGARALVIGQAAEKVYRSLGPDCAIENQIAVASQAWVEFLPQETILFDQARLRRATVVTLAEDARFLGGGIMAFGRKAKGETFDTGLLHDVWEIRSEHGALIWKDALHLEGDIGATLGSAGFAGASVLGTIVYAGADAAMHLPDIRLCAAQQPDVRIAATQFRGLLVIRLLGKDGLALRQGFAVLWATLRARAADLPAIMPRLWSI